MMDEETWLTAEQALVYGFVDQIDEQSAVTNQMKDGLLIVNSISCDLAKFKHADKVKELLNRKDKVATMGENTGNDLLNKIADLLGVTEKKSTNKDPLPTISAEDAVQAERQRILALDALDDRTNVAVTKIVIWQKRTAVRRWMCSRMLMRLGAR